VLFAWQMAKKCFHCLAHFLKLRAMLDHSNKGELQRQLRLCARLSYLDRGMPIYYRHKLRWKCFTQWLRHIDDNVYQLVPMALTKTLPRKRMLFTAFSQLLLLGAEPDSAHCIFCRWLQYTQARIGRRALSHLLRRKYVLRLAHICFCALAGRADPEALALYKRNYAVRREAAALDTWRRKFLSPRLVSERRQRAHRSASSRRQLCARTPQLRVRLQSFRASVEQRLRHEAQLFFRWAAQALAAGGDAATLGRVPAMLQLRRHSVLSLLRRAEAATVALAGADWRTLRGEEGGYLSSAGGYLSSPSSLSPLRAPEEPPALSELSAFSVHVWFFEALAVQLVPLPPAETRDDEAAGLRASALPTSERYWARISALLASAKHLAHRLSAQQLFSRSGVLKADGGGGELAARSDAGSHPGTHDGSRPGSRPDT